MIWDTSARFQIRQIAKSIAKAYFINCLDLRFVMKILLLKVLYLFQTPNPTEHRLLQAAYQVRRASIRRGISQDGVLRGN